MDEDVTRLLMRLNEGDRTAYDSLLPVIYERLQQLAHGLMRRERKDHTLQTTALVHEACLRLLDMRRTSWEDRSHFFRVAARAMRRVLVDHARTRNRLKRGPGATRLPLDLVMDEVSDFFGCPDLDVLALDLALDHLESTHPRPAQVVESLFFAGLSRPETAQVLQVSAKTVERDWLFARAWLIRDLERTRHRPSGLP